MVVAYIGCDMALAYIGVCVCVLCVGGHACGVARAGWALQISRHDSVYNKHVHTTTIYGRVQNFAAMLSTSADTWVSHPAAS